jgi:hypothetical protein
LVSRALRNRTADHVGRSQRGGSERGLQLYRNEQTSELREARRGYPSGGDFTHIIERRAGETLVIVSHLHNGSDQAGTAGRSLTTRNNAPSELDQAAMHKEVVPVQVVGPYNTGTLYRENSQDYYAVETGNPENVPSLRSQHIVVRDTRNERDEEERPGPR